MPVGLLGLEPAEIESDGIGHTIKEGTGMICYWIRKTCGKVYVF